MHKDIAAALLKRHEGYKQKPYLCTAGKHTIGYGYQLESHGFSQIEIAKLQKDGWTQSHAERMLEHEIDLICAAFHRLPWFDYLDYARKAVVIDMAYQHGIGGFLEYKDTIAAIKKKDWEQAAFQMRNSIWATKHKNRCAKLCKIMETGVVDDN